MICDVKGALLITKSEKCFKPSSLEVTTKDRKDHFFSIFDLFIDISCTFGFLH